jgi:hypothetical protein
MLHPETVFASLGSRYPIFYARPGVSILSIRTGQFRGDFIKFEALEIQEFDSMTLPQF